MDKCRYHCSVLYWLSNGAEPSYRRDQQPVGPTDPRSDSGYRPGRRRSHLAILLLVRSDYSVFAPVTFLQLPEGHDFGGSNGPATCDRWSSFLPPRPLREADHLHKPREIIKRWIAKLMLHL